MKQSTQRGFTVALFAVYIVILIWIIVFKMQTDINLLPELREVYFIPFYRQGIKNLNFYIRDIIYNMLIFIPFGMYIAALNQNKKRDKMLIQKIIPITAISLTFETVQFVFSIGAADVNDLIQNTLGGVIGIFVFSAMLKLLKGKTFKLFNILAATATTVMLVFVALLLTEVLRYRPV